MQPGTDHISRRKFLGATGALAALGSSMIWLPRRSGALDPPGSLQRLLIETPRECCTGELARRLRTGTTRQQIAAALLDVAMRSVDFHHVGFVVHAGLRAAPLAPRPEQPLLWCVDYFKSWQGRMRDPELAPLPELDVQMDVAAADVLLERGLSAMDGDAVARALVALRREAGPSAAWERMWRIGSRDWTFVGHRAIAPAMLHRATGVLGDASIEPALRWLGPFQFYWYATGGKGQCWPENVARAHEHAAKAAAGWSATSDDVGPTFALLDAIRSGSVEDACTLALSQLTSGATPAIAVWDAVNLAAVELLLRTKDVDRLGQFPVHAVTAAEALHHAARSSRVHSTRLLATMQGVGWLAEFTREAGKDSALSDARIDTLEAAEAAPALEDIAAQLRPRASAGRGLPCAKRADQRSQAPAMLAWTRRAPSATPLRQLVIEGVLRSARADPHHLKLPVALFDMSEQVSPRWRPLIEASLVHTLASPDSPATDFFGRLER